MHLSLHLGEVVQASPHLVELPALGARAHAAGPFWASGTFWGGAGFAAVVVFGLVSLVTWRLGPPRPVLVYSLQSAISLIRSGPMLGVAPGEIKVSYRDHPVRSPHVAELRVRCKGRGEIASKDFDGERPLVFDLGAPVVAVISTNQAGTKVPDEHLSTEDSQVRISPCVIRRGPVLSMEFLTEGRPILTCDGDSNPLIHGVKVRDSTAETLRVNISLAVLYLAGMGLLAFAVFGLGWDRSVWGEKDFLAAASFALFSVPGAFVLMWAAWERGPGRNRPHRPVR